VLGRLLRTTTDSSSKYRGPDPGDYGVRVRPTRAVVTPRRPLRRRRDQLRPASRSCLGLTARGTLFTSYGVRSTRNFNTRRVLTVVVLAHSAPCASTLVVAPHDDRRRPKSGVDKSQLLSLGARTGHVDASRRFRARHPSPSAHTSLRPSIISQAAPSPNRPSRPGGHTPDQRHRLGAPPCRSRPPRPGVAPKIHRLDPCIGRAGPRGLEPFKAPTGPLPSSTACRTHDTPVNVLTQSRFYCTQYGTASWTLDSASRSLAQVRPVWSS